MFDGQLNRVIGGSPSNAGRPPRVRTSRLAGGICMMLVMTLVFNWSTAAFAVKPPPERAKAIPKEKARARRVDAPKTVTRAHRDQVPGRMAKEEPVKIPGPGEPRPIIECKDLVKDFGTVWVGPVLKHSFTIENKGEAPLRITKVRPSCGCTIAGPYPKMIEPGQSGSFPFSVHSNKLRGRFEKGITIKSNDPANPNFRLRLRGEVKRYVELTPSAINFGKLYGDEPMEKVIKIKNNTDEPIQVELGTQLKTENFKAEVVASEAGKAYELHVRAEPPYKPGTIREILLLKTSNENQRRISVNVRANIPRRLDVSPAVLTVRPPRPVKGKAPDATLTRVVKFNNYGSAPVKLLEATVNDPNVKVDIQEQNVGKRYAVQVEFPKGYQTPAMGRKLTLKTNDPETPVIEVPIRGMPKAPDSKPREQRKRPAQEMIGKAAPAFEGTTIDGKAFTSKDLAGNVTVMDFFAVNCGYCGKQIPRLETIRKEYADKGVRFVAVSQTMRNKKYSQEDVIDKLKGLGFRGETAYDPDNRIGPQFKATSYPTMVVVGKTGKVDAVNIGNLADLETRLKGQLDALLAGKPVPKFEAVTTKTPEKKPKPTPPARKSPADLVGKPAPAFSFKTLDGKEYNNAEVAKASATVLNIVATNCGYCKKQIPRIEKLREKYAAKGVRFVNVVETMRTKFETDDVVKTMKDVGSNLDLAHDPDNKVGGLFNARGFPSMVILGKSGKVEAANIGNLSDLETRLTGQLDALIAGKPVPKFADAKPPAKREYADALIGKPAPAFAIKTLDGKDISNAELAKSPATILNFVAPNCGYCKKQIPRIEKLRQKYAEKGVRFVNVAQTMGKKYETGELVKVMEGLGSNIELAHDPDNKVGTLFKARGFPTMIVVGKDGKVAATNIGNMPDLDTRLTAQLDAMIAGKPIPRSAMAKPKQPKRKRPAMDLVGKPAPQFALKTLEGKSLSTADFKNHPATVLNFVAPNCGYCKRQLPNVEAVRKEYEAKGIRFVNVVQKMRKDFTVGEMKDVLEKTGANLEIVTGDFAEGKVGREQFKAVSYPTMVVVDKTGKIAHVNIGAQQDLEKTLKGQLDTLMAGKPTATP